MSNKTHLKVIGVDCRNQGQTESEFNTQALCGFAEVTVSRNAKDVTCKTCLKKMAEFTSDDDDYFDNAM